MCFVGNFRYLSVFLCLFFLSLLYFYPLLRDPQSKTPVSLPDNVRSTRDKAGLYLLSEKFKITGCQALHLCGWRAVDAGPCTSAPRGTGSKAPFLLLQGKWTNSVDSSRRTCPSLKGLELLKSPLANACLSTNEIKGLIHVLGGCEFGDFQEYNISIFNNLVHD